MIMNYQKQNELIKSIDKYLLSNGREKLKHDQPLDKVKIMGFYGTDTYINLKTLTITEFKNNKKMYDMYFNTYEEAIDFFNELVWGSEKL